MSTAQEPFEGPLDVCLSVSYVIVLIGGTKVTPTIVTTLLQWSRRVLKEAFPLKMKNVQNIQCCSCSIFDPLKVRSSVSDGLQA